ncbi:oxidized low-density lipoprotein receptor 1-like [Hypanus sabinus]|uniref:oxidized low-density lipoprotein receptor 1-like n=1 Tax=Hypanus sabinus TaxID=79690 RepID=UPI0028C44CD8|nr:oxidized low-density lipoprotein receptor 1-like [Hypanus sabinus]
MAFSAAQEKERKLKIGNRPYRVICLLCLVTSALIVTVVGLSIHVSQIRQSKVTSDRNYHELNSTLQSELSALNSNLSDLKRRHSDLRHQFTEMETKYRSVNETKDRICELLNSSREQTCSENWIRNRDRCYFISAIDESYDAAKQHCSRFDSRLLEINSNDEANFVYNSIRHGYRTYWIGKCEDRNVESNLLYTVKDRKPTCTRCKSNEWNYKCGDEHYFICEKSASLFSDVLEKMLDLCQEPMSPS